MLITIFLRWSWIFFVYAFFGWCVEVIFHAVSEGKFINRGFLIGPVCPIYGFGVLTVILCLEPVKSNPLLLFLGSVILTSVLEFITGLILEKIFNDKWWDYSKEPLNLFGYICIRFSLAWGLACILVIDVIHPIVIKSIDLLSPTSSLVLLFIIYSLIFTDLTVTLIETLKLRKLLFFAESAEKGLRMVSDGIGEALTNTTLDAMERFEESREAVEFRKAKTRVGLSSVQKRILSAYPRLREGRHRDVLLKLKEKFKSEIRTVSEYKK